MSDPRRAVAVMAKRPRPGETKTRLQPVLGSEGAAAFYECLLRDTLDLAATVPGADPVIAFAPADEADYFAGLAPDLTLVPQIGADLGQRLDHVIGHLLDTGYDQVLAIGSDSPTLPVSEITSAFRCLDRPDVDAVFGPAEDGGYYLIGTTHRPGPLVTEVTMSTPTVLADTLAIAERNGIRTELLGLWYDIDEPTDLDRLRPGPAASRPTGDGRVGADRSRRFLAEVGLDRG